MEYILSLISIFHIYFLKKQYIWNKWYFFSKKALTRKASFWFRSVWAQSLILSSLAADLPSSHNRPTSVVVSPDQLEARNPQSNLAISAEKRHAVFTPPDETPCDLCMVSCGSWGASWHRKHRLVRHGANRRPYHDRRDANITLNHRTWATGRYPYLLSPILLIQLYLPHGVTEHHILLYLLIPYPPISAITFFWSLPLSPII